MEATGRLEHEAALALCATGWPVMAIHPRQARRFGEAAAGCLSKTDAIDARCLAAQAHDLRYADKREHLFMRLPTEKQETLLAWVTRRAQRIEIREGGANSTAWRAHSSRSGAASSSSSKC